MLLIDAIKVLLRLCSAVDAQVARLRHIKVLLIDAIKVLLINAIKVLLRLCRAVNAQVARPRHAQPVRADFSHKLQVHAGLSS